MNRKILTFLFLITFCAFSSFGESINFRASAPSTVAKGQQFRLSYTINTEGTDLNVPESIKGFDVLYGPSISSSYSTTIINGKSSSESSITYTYILQAKSEGTYSLPAASIKVNGKTYSSNSARVTVVPPDKNSQIRQQQQQQGIQRPQAVASSSTPGKISPNDAFIRAIISKTKVHEQEAFLVTFRFYTRLGVQDIGQVQFPEFEGFMVEEVDMPQNQQLRVENYNGQNYYAVDLKKSLLFPQRSGNLVIPQGKIEMVFQVPSGVSSFFGEEMTAVKKTVTTKPINIRVESLPTPKPGNFSNGVGSFSMSSSITSHHVKANEAVTIKVVISGTGNTKLIKNPEFELPDEIESYDPKITQNVKVTENGLSGSKTIEYLIIPRYEGSYKIPAVTMSYFDTHSKSYKTLSTQEFSLKVDKDPNAAKGGASSNYGNQKDLLAQQDIRYLKTEPYAFQSINDFLFDSWTYYLWYLLPAFLFVGFSIAYRKQIKENANLVLLRNKKANKVANKRLKLAKKYLLGQDKSSFYEEILRAVWGYLSDKLTIPVANLNRDNIEIELTKYGADDMLRSDFMYILDTSEFARYAPAESTDAMDKLYQTTVEAIGKMENAAKAKRKQ
ncbi:MAG: hypothetical protein H6Q14_1691 [Bacteroidetes bacterium]|jgi:hypothetical protein|nr:hypothetical protein [Bacteroidota bacterium]